MIASQPAPTLAPTSQGFMYSSGAPQAGTQAGGGASGSVQTMSAPIGAFGTTGAAGAVGGVGQAGQLDPESWWRTAISIGRTILSTLGTEPAMAPGMAGMGGQSGPMQTLSASVGLPGGMGQQAGQQAGQLDPESWWRTAISIGRTILSTLGTQPGTGGLAGMGGQQVPQYR